jgi:hypothetical protein
MLKMLLSPVQYENRKDQDLVPLIDLNHLTGLDQDLDPQPGLKLILSIRHWKEDGLMV